MKTPAASPRRVVLGVTGSIAAYKACEVVRGCVRRGWDVRVVMTPAAARFVAPLTFQTLSRNPVGLDEFAPPAHWEPSHIGLAEWAELLVVAPCTANTLAKLARGFACDLLSSTALATRAPRLLAPAMNTGMWENPATQENLEILRRRGDVVLEPAVGELACGSEGRGRMPAPEAVLDAMAEVLGRVASGSRAP